MNRTLIIGATSAIAVAVARRWSDAGDALFLIARDEAKLAAVTEDLQVRGASSIGTATLDVLDHDRYQSVLDHAHQALGGFDRVLIAHGTLPDLEACQRDAALTRREFDTNALSVIVLLTLLSPYFEQQHAGQLAVISSVAGDRGRKSNYLYGSAKSAVSTFVQGLRNRLHEYGVNVLTIKPGFVDTPMTARFAKGPLWAQPEEVASAICKAMDKRRDVVYVPWFWWGIMLIIKLIPERIFKRLTI